MRTTVDIDDTVLDALRAQTGLQTKRETVDCALRFLLEKIEEGTVVLDTDPDTDGHLVLLSDADAGALQRAVEAPPARRATARLLCLGQSV